MKTEQTFGQWLRDKLASNKVTQAQLAELAGTSRQHIGNMVRGQRHPQSGAVAMPSMEMLDKIAIALRIPIEEAREAAGFGLPELVKTKDGIALSQDEVQLLLTYRQLPRTQKADLLAALIAVCNLHNDTPQSSENYQPTQQIAVSDGILLLKAPQ